MWLEIMNEHWIWEIEQHLKGAKLTPRQFIRLSNAINKYKKTKKGVWKNDVRSNANKKKCRRTGTRGL